MRKLLSLPLITFFVLGLSVGELVPIGKGRGGTTVTIGPQDIKLIGVSANPENKPDYTATLTLYITIDENVFSSAGTYNVKLRGTSEKVQVTVTGKSPNLQISNINDKNNDLATYIYKKITEGLPPTNYVRVESPALVGNKYYEIKVKLLPFSSLPPILWLVTTSEAESRYNSIYSISAKATANVFTTFNEQASIKTIIASFSEGMNLIDIRSQLFSLSLAKYITNSVNECFIRAWKSLGYEPADKLCNRINSEASALLSKFGINLDAVYTYDTGSGSCTLTKDAKADEEVMSVLEGMGFKPSYNTIEEMVFQLKKGDRFICWLDSVFGAIFGSTYYSIKGLLPQNITNREMVALIITLSLWGMLAYLVIKRIGPSEENKNIGIKHFIGGLAISYLLLTLLGNSLSSMSSAHIIGSILFLFFTYEIVSYIVALISHPRLEAIVYLVLYGLYVIALSVFLRTMGIVGGASEGVFNPTKAIALSAAMPFSDIIGGIAIPIIYQALLGFQVGWFQAIGWAWLITKIITYIADLVGITLPPFLDVSKKLKEKLDKDLGTFEWHKREGNEVEIAKRVIMNIASQLRDLWTNIHCSTLGARKLLGRKFNPVPLTGALLYVLSDEDNKALILQKIPDEDQKKIVENVLNNKLEELAKSLAKDDKFRSLLMNYCKDS